MNSSVSAPTAPNRFELLIKPAGPACNLDCSYCFYLEKGPLFPAVEGTWMSDEMLESLTRQYLEACGNPEVTFAWQGGEPTLLGIDFYRRAVAFQRHYAQGKRVRNTIQTNGTLLNDAWGEFLAEHGFLVGLSLDGPAEVHDTYRRDHRGEPTHAAAMRGLGVLRRFGVPFNTLTTVNRRNAPYPGEVYRFLKDCGSAYWQFIPVVERISSASGGRPGWVRPPGSAGPGGVGEVAPWSVEPEAYGGFLTGIFDRWVREDVGRVFVQLFDAALANWLRADPGLCLFAETCGRGPALERNGGVFACDHYVFPEYERGNVGGRGLAESVRSAAQERFGRHKADALPEYCRRCDVRFACQGECPKNRFALTPDGQTGLNYLCPAYRRFFHHADPCLRLMAQFVLQGQPAANIMACLRQIDSESAGGQVQEGG